MLDKILISCQFDQKGASRVKFEKEPQMSGEGDNVIEVSRPKLKSKLLQVTPE